MKIVILGAGQVGTSTARILSAEEHHDVSLVDLNAEILQTIQDRLDIQTVHGNCMFPEVLAEAGAEDAELLMAVTTSDEVNMMACHIAKSLFNVPKLIARIRAQSFLRRENELKKSIPITTIISPESIVTRQVLRMMEHPGALQVLDFADGKIQLVAIRAEENSPIVGHKIKELHEHLPNVDSRVAAIYRQGAPVMPDGDTTIEPDDEVFFVAARQNIRQVMKELHSEVSPTRRVMIAGAGNIGYRLAEAVERRKYNCKLIERSHDRAQEVSELLNDTVVLQGDAADEELLRQENIDNIDVFCAVTNDDEANILSAMLAKRLGAGVVIALVNRPAYTELIEDTGVDIAIAPRTATVGTLLTTIRRGDMVAVHSLRNGAAEAIEVIPHGDPNTSHVIGRRIGEIKLPGGTKIGALLRGDDVFIAHDNVMIEENDHVILFVPEKQSIPEVEKLFALAPTSL